MGGGYFVTGWGLTYWGGYRNPPDGFVLDDPVDDPWEQQVQHVYDLFTSLEWWKLEPADHLVRADGDDRGRTAWCLAEPGRQYVVYVRNAVTVTVQLGQAEGPYRVNLFDPRTGERTDVGRVDSGKQPLDVPDEHDHVFILTGKSNGS